MVGEILDFQRLTIRQATRRLTRLFAEDRFQPMPLAVVKLQKRGFDLEDVRSAIRAGRVVARRRQDDHDLYEFEGVTFDGALLRLLFDIRKTALLLDLVKTRRSRR